MSRPECEELRDRLPELLEDDLRADLPAPARERLTEHTRACAECREAMRAYQALLTGLQALPRMPAPAGFRERVLGELERGAGAGGPVVAGRSAEGRLIRLSRIGIGIAATLAIAGGVWLSVELFMERPAGEMSLSERDRTLSGPIHSRLSGSGDDPVTLRLSARNEEEAQSVVQLAMLFTDSLSRDELRPGGRQRLIAFDIEEARLPDLEEGLRGLGNPTLGKDGGWSAEKAGEAFFGEAPGTAVDEARAPARKAPAAAATEPPGASGEDRRRSRVAARRESPPAPGALTRPGAEAPVEAGKKLEKGREEGLAGPRESAPQRDPASREVSLPSRGAAPPPRPPGLEGKLEQVEEAGSALEVKRKLGELEDLSQLRAQSTKPRPEGDMDQKKGEESVLMKEAGEAESLEANDSTRDLAALRLDRQASRTAGRPADPASRPPVRKRVVIVVDLP